jgi:bla regulator protein BlaR1
LTANGGNLDGLALLLGRQPEIGGRSVVNKTGITGSYDVALHWTRTGSATAATDDASAQYENAPSFFTAIQEQLGLRLATTKGQVDYVVVDHIEKPSAN